VAATKKAWAWAAVTGTKSGPNIGRKIVQATGCAVSEKAAAKTVRSKMRSVGIFGAAGAIHEGRGCGQATKFAKKALTVITTAKYQRNGRLAIKKQAALKKEAKGLRRGFFFT